MYILFAMQALISLFVVDQISNHTVDPWVKYMKTDQGNILDSTQLSLDPNALQFPWDMLFGVIF